MGMSLVKIWHFDRSFEKATDRATIDWSGLEEPFAVGCPFLGCLASWLVDLKDEWQHYIWPWVQGISQEHALPATKTVPKAVNTSKNTWPRTIHLELVKIACRKRLNTTVTPPMRLILQMASCFDQSKSSIVLASHCHLQGFPRKMMSNSIRKLLEMNVLDWQLWNNNWSSRGLIRHVPLCRSLKSCGQTGNSYSVKQSAEERPRPSSKSVFLQIRKKKRKERGTFVPHPHAFHGSWV